MYVAINIIIISQPRASSSSLRFTSPSSEPTRDPLGIPFFFAYVCVFREGKGRKEGMKVCVGKKNEYENDARNDPHPRPASFFFPILGLWTRKRKKNRIEKWYSIQFRYWYLLLLSSYRYHVFTYLFLYCVHCTSTFYTSDNRQIALIIQMNGWMDG